MICYDRIHDDNITNKKMLRYDKIENDIKTNT